MAETLFDELKRYVGFDPHDQALLLELRPAMSPEYPRIAEIFYRRILEHEGARAALVGGERRVGKLKTTLVAWMDQMLSGPWDEAYFDVRCRIGRMHVRIDLPQHYMFGAMNVIRREMLEVVERTGGDRASGMSAALEKILDLELAIMLHTYREDLLAQQARSERLSTFGQLVGSIGHELRNPLGVMETSLFILRQRMGDDERVQKHLGRIGEQLQLANAIVTQLLDMIRDKPLQRETIDLAPVLQSAAVAVCRPEGVGLHLGGFEALPKVSGDPVQLRQVFVNLLENAVHATSPVGAVRVQAGLEDGQAVVRVKDTGPGVPEAIRRRIFEPLVSTKEKGIGLGLALVKRIVERHGGSVTYLGEAGEGACFVVRLPVGL
jgi:two-component system, NtrC family, sensor histidine kinase HydH